MALTRCEGKVPTKRQACTRVPTQISKDLNSTVSDDDQPIPWEELAAVASGTDTNPVGSMGRTILYLRRVEVTVVTADLQKRDAIATLVAPTFLHAAGSLEPSGSPPN